ncbi:AMP-binding protein [Gordonia sihwensis]|uniref:AMP-binding protein n=1 Tax=Gordonia sihwensis TaxID=173559 RepID=UPI0009E2A48A|nr:AMP-binding protein [Gordonia sihwensis]
MNTGPVITLARSDHTRTSRSQAECLDRAGRLASAIHDDHIAAVGDNVGLLAHNSIEFVEASIAIASAGGRPVPINWHWTPHEIRHVLVDADITVLFVGPEFVDTARAAAALADRELRLIALTPTPGVIDVEHLIAEHTSTLAHVEGALAASLGLIYTSGTTGAPKGVARETMTATQILSVAGSTATRMGLRDGGTALIAGPLYHTSPNAISTLALRMGSNLILMERYESEHMLALIDEFDVEHVKVVPTMLSRILSLPAEVRGRYNLSSLTHVIHSAAPCPPDIKRRAISLFGNALTEFYGCSEAGTITWITADEWLEHPGSVGRPADGAAVHIVDDNGTPVPAGTEGRVLVRGADYWPRFGYLNHGGLEPEFIDVGDIGYLDDDGFLYLSGRSSEVVIIGGTNVYPAEVEAAALSHPSIEDAAAVGVPAEHGDLGEQIVLHVVARPGTDVDPASVAAHLIDRLASVKMPRRIVVRGELPRDDNGKLYRKDLVGEG